MKRVEGAGVDLALDHMWRASCGCRWAFFWVEGIPFLGCEADA